MRNQPSADPRDQALRAALRDAAALAAIVAGEFHSTYEGAHRSEYVRVLGTYVADLSGVLDDAPTGLVAAFEDRRIAIKFGPLSGGR